MAFNSGLWWPWGRFPNFPSAGSNALDATGEYVAVVGRIAIEGQATSKTIDTTGSSKIYFSVASAPVFDNASSVFTIGFQGVDKTTGVPVRPDGSWAARAVITTAADSTPTLTTTADWHSIVPTAGTTTLSHGDECAFVMEMTTKAGTDAVTARVFTSPDTASMQYPAGATNISGSVAAASNLTFVIVFSDGTLGTMDGIFVHGGGSTGDALTFADASNPDEYGLIFQVPFACAIDAIGFQLRTVDAASDLQFDLVSSPTSSPASLISGPIALTAENTAGRTVDGNVVVSFAPINLSANTDYAVAVKATSTSNVRWNRINLPVGGARSLVSAMGTAGGQTTRNGGSGNYGAASTTIMNPLAVRISNITTASGGNANILGGSVIA